jgi:hypothetical protein
VNSVSVRGFGSGIGCSVLQFGEVESDGASGILNAFEDGGCGVEFAQAGGGCVGIGRLLEPVRNLALQFLPEGVLLFEKGGEWEHGE